MKWELLVLLGLLAVLVVSGCIDGQQVENLTKPEQQISIWSSCPGSRVLLQKAVYYMNNQSLDLKIYNYGHDDLNLSVSLSLSDSIEKRPDVYFVGAGERKVFTVENVTDDLTEVMVKSIECPRVQDFRPWIDIEGLGYTS
jgi:hypothetical protein